MTMQVKGHDQLSGPFVLFEEGDDDALFFETLREILDDPDDILRHDLYVGYDAHGARFALRRVSRPRPVLFGLLTRQASVLELDRVEGGAFADEARSRIAAWLRAAATECYGEPETRWPAQARRTYSTASLAARSLEELLRLGLQWAQDEPQS